MLSGFYHYSSLMRSQPELKWVWHEIKRQCIRALPRQDWPGVVMSSFFEAGERGDFARDMDAQRRYEDPLQTELDVREFLWHLRCEVPPYQQSP